MKKRATFLFGLIFLLILTGFVSAGTCRDERGNYYYCEKYTRYSDCEYWDYGYNINYRYGDDYYNRSYPYNDDYYYYHTDCSYYGNCLSYMDKYGNIVREIRPHYTRYYRCEYDYKYWWPTRKHYYDYQDDPYYPDYYKYEMTKPDTELKPSVIYVK